VARIVVREESDVPSELEQVRVPWCWLAGTHAVHWVPCLRPLPRPHPPWLPSHHPLPSPSRSRRQPSRWPTRWLGRGCCKSPGCLGPCRGARGRRRTAARPARRRSRRWCPP
jgi:hypothetical protein